MTTHTLAPSVQLVSIVSFLRERILHRIHIPDAELGNDMNLSDLGVTSLDAVLISGELEDHYDFEIDPAIMFQYKTVNAVAEHLAEVFSAL